MGDNIDNSLSTKKAGGRLSRKQNDLVAEDELGAGLDPVKAYLREMGAVPLLSPAEETSIAKRIEKGDRQVQRALFSLSMTIKKFQSFRGMIEDGKNISDILRGLDHEPRSAPKPIVREMQFLGQVAVRRDGSAHTLMVITFLRALHFRVKMQFDR